MLLTTDSIDQMLSHLRIDGLNEMQTATLEAAQQPGDLVLLSDTGSGKTLAFLLPILAFMDEKTAGTQALIIVPSRELAIQIERVFKTMGTGFKVTCCYGGHLRETEENNLIEAPALIVGTPGRLADHLRRKNIHPETIKTLVLDEFDKSLELGFQEEMAGIIDALPALTKRILTSATGSPAAAAQTAAAAETTAAPTAAAETAATPTTATPTAAAATTAAETTATPTTAAETTAATAATERATATAPTEIPAFVGLQSAQTLNFLSGKKTERLTLQQVASPDKDKIDTLYRLICRIGDRSAVIFCNHRDSVDRVSALLKDKGLVNVFYHGALEQRERDSALAKFRNGSSQILVTTDLAARGLDVPNIRYIIHYHLPATEEIYTHRNGRTARMEASGTAIFILSTDETLPSYLPEQPETIELPETATPPAKPKWTTLFISAGKKDKVNKVDIVGFFTNKGHLKKEDIGLIEVKDFFSFVAVRKSSATHTLQAIKNEKLKNQKVKIDVAK